MGTVFHRTGKHLRNNSNNNNRINDITNIHGHDRGRNLQNDAPIVGEAETSEVVNNDAEEVVYIDDEEAFEEYVEDMDDEEREEYLEDLEEDEEEDDEYDEDDEEEDDEYEEDDEEEDDEYAEENDAEE